MSSNIERDEEDDYNSSEDEDFNPGGDTRAALDDGDSNSGSSSDSDSEDDDGDSNGDTSGKKRDKTKTKSKNKTNERRASKKAEAKDVDEEDVDSGDEVVIQTGKRKRDDSTKDKDDEYDGGEDDGGEGGLIKTRAQRAKEDAHKQKIPRATTASSTIDVDALWKSMNTDAKPSEKPVIETNKSTVNENAQATKPTPNTSSTDPGKLQGDKLESQTSKPLASIAAATAAAQEPLVKDGMIKIKRTYEFAGEVTTEERLVPADSFEARAYLASLSEPKQTTSEGTASSANATKKPPLRRPTKRTSLFDPANPAKPKATKLTTLEKSRLDWAGYVDKEGLAEELDKQKKTGTGFLERRDFLDRVADRTTGRK